MQSDSPSSPLIVLAAGSLRNVFAGIIREFELQSGVAVQVEHGPAGLLREQIEQGVPFDAFASANMAHPRRLEALGLAGPTLCFARNRLCIIARRNLGMTKENLLDVLLDPNVKLGTSTPQADPSGDYALEFFDKVEALSPGSGQALKEKALALVGGRVPVSIPSGYSAAGWIIEQELADAFISYATNGLLSEDDENLSVVALPKALGPMAEYGITLRTEPCADALLFRNYIVSAKVKQELNRYGFV